MIELIKNTIICSSEGAKDITLDEVKNPVSYSAITVVGANKVVS